MITTIKLGESFENQICPHCKQHFASGEEAITCPSCQTLHHASCWNNNGGCSTFGCSEQRKSTPKSTSVSFCGKCGTPLAAGQTFCTNCGCPKEFSSFVAPPVSQTTSKIPVRTSEVVLNTIFSLLSTLFFFVPLYFWYEDDGRTHFQDFTYLVCKNDDFFLFFLVFGSLATLLLCTWIGFFQKKRIPAANIICSIAALCSTVFGSLYCKDHFDYVGSYYFYGYQKWIEIRFKGFSLTFIVEILLLSALVIFSIIYQVKAARQKSA